MSAPESTRLKVVFVGDAGVGKTSIITKRVTGKFDYQMDPTVGASHVSIELKEGGEAVELCIWDTAGQENFASLVSICARDSKAAILVASILDLESIKNIDAWTERLHAAGEDPPLIVAINKLDMQEGAPISEDQIREMYGDKYPNLYFVSAKTGDGINELFATIAEESLRNLKHHGKSPSIDIAGTDPQPTKKCCA